MGSSFLIPSLQDWQKALDQANIEAAVVYPTRFMHIGQVGMIEFATDLSRAYNDYLYDRFLRHEARLKGMTTSHDLDLLGDHCLFWASDFPHEGIVDMSQAVNEFLGRQDLSESSKRKISYDNPKQLYRL